MQISLRERDLNPGFLESVVNRNGQLATHAKEIVNAGPAQQRKVQRTVTETIEHGLRRWHGQDFRMFLSKIHQDIDHPAGIGAERDTNRYLNPSLAPGKGPVDNPRSDKLTVGNDDVGAIDGAHDTGAKTDLANLAEESADLLRTFFAERR